MPGTTTHTTAHSSKISWVWWVFAGVGLIVTVGIVGVALFVSLRSDRPLDPNQVMLALIALLGSLGALIVPKLNAVGKNTSQTAEHVVNSHTKTILRDDIDEIKRMGVSTAARMGQLEQAMSHQSRDIIGIRQEIGQIRQIERDQWDAIESTASRRRKKGQQ